ncbi:hypothetical protein GCM10009836_43790 [Pseudonocardia ailaonensis]|uniref:DUF2889 domain-containing protein n=1 Tax=Pseudonocardia ailaonensis TaxID=367279 RepID=A0ABN2N9B9_9PSEU
MTTDMVRPDGLGGKLVLSGNARDLLTRTVGGTPEVVATAATRLEVDYMDGWGIRSLTSEPSRDALKQLVGTAAGSGFRRRMIDVDPGLLDEVSLLHQLLDDVPVATLVSGQAYMAGLVVTDGVDAKFGSRRFRSGRASFGRDMCAGYIDGGTVMTGIDLYGASPLVDVPVAGRLATDDMWAWHELPELPRHAMRRARRIDVVPVDSCSTTVDVYFRDSSVTHEGIETVVHEYEVSMDVEDGEVTSIAATPRVLPWIECPAAAASAGRLLGVPLEGLRAHIRSAFTGVGTCTHLSDTLRSLGDIPELISKALAAPAA